MDMRTGIEMNTFGNAVVTDINSAAIRRFERCVEKLEVMTGRTGIPAASLSRHPAILPVIKEMQSLLERIAVEDTGFDMETLTRVVPPAETSSVAVG
jgi:hypothetical protein